MSYVFNIGLNRAGTSSLNDALNILGIPSLHHRYKGKRLPEIIRHNKKKGRSLFHGINEYTAFTDFAGWNHYATLDRQYPNSKFIFTYRHLDEWLTSLERHNYKHGGSINVQKWKDRYNRVIPGIMKYFENRDDFLLINIPRSEGWEKLCPFFDKQIPQIHFPHKNKSYE